MNRAPLDQVDLALLELGRGGIGAQYGSPVNVGGIGPNDFDDDGRLVFQSPAVRLRFLQASHAPKDNQRTLYEASATFIALVYCENLRSDVDEKLDTLKLLNAVLETYAGARLRLQSGATTQPITIGDVLPMKDGDDDIDGFYSVQLLVPTLVTFSGSNSNNGGQHA